MEWGLFIQWGVLGPFIQEVWGLFQQAEVLDPFTQVELGFPLLGVLLGLLKLVVLDFPQQEVLMGELDFLLLGALQFRLQKVLDRVLLERGLHALKVFSPLHYQEAPGQF